MSNIAQQIDKGSLRNYMSPGTKKEAKKQQTRRKRRESKNVDSDHPQYNRYEGGWVM